MNRTCGWDGLAFCPAAWGGFSSVACVVLFLDGGACWGAGLPPGRCVALEGAGGGRAASEAHCIWRRGAIPFLLLRYF